MYDLFCCLHKMQAGHVALAGEAGGAIRVCP